jgi:drug/metabolite transporter (DMT)-like permease
MDRIFAKIRPQILFIILALVGVAWLVLSDTLSSEVKGTIIGAVVGGLIMIGKDLIQLDRDKAD